MADPLSSLPSELYTEILDHVPLEYLQSTTLSLSRCLPRVPTYHLFTSVRLKRPEQPFQLYRRLHRSSDDSASFVSNFSLESWTADADIVVNVIRLLPNLVSLNLYIGPSNFAPELLEDLFQQCIPTLKYLSLRFRPYVQRATYFQFLKGAYFDSTLLALSKWPYTALPTLSITQDQLEAGVARTQAFAQPLVFFRLDACLPLLVRSPYLASLTSLRLHIPSRSITSTIATHPMSLPAIEYLDLSTCNVMESEVDMLPVRFIGLKHLVLDECPVLRGDLRRGDWSALGKRLALVGARRAKEREKKLKTWLETNAAEAFNSGQGTGGLHQVPRIPPRKIRKGRKGLATAAISLRDPPPNSSNPLPRMENLFVPKIRIIPPFPNLLSFATTTSSSIPPDRYPALRAEFDSGWAEGLAQLSVTRARLRQSFVNGIRVVKFDEEDDEHSEEGLDGLEDIEEGDHTAFDGVIAGRSEAAPVLCLVGSAPEAEHAVGCAHSVGWKIWNNNL